MEKREEKRQVAKEIKIQEALKRLESLISMYDNPTQAVLIPYIAGIIDGEGTIRINKCQILGYKNDSYHLSMSCGMTFEGVPKLLKEILGGSYRKERGVKDWKPLWRWNLTGRIQLYAAISMIYPFLLVKKEQAKLALTFCEEWKNPRRGTRNIWVFDSRQLQWREEMYQEMRKLNARGAGAETKRVGSREAEAIVRSQGKL
jgi:hypothetical protein